MEKGNKPGIGAALIAAFIIAVVLLLIIPQVVLTLVGLLTLVGFFGYAFNKSKKQDSIGSKPQAVQKPLAAADRVAKPPPPPPPRLQQTKNSSDQKLPEKSDATERIEDAPFLEDSLGEGKPFDAETHLVENPAAREPLVSAEAGLPVAPKAVKPIQLPPKQDALDDPVRVLHSHPAASVNFRVPRAPQSHGKGTWIPYGEIITVKNVIIPGGMIYVGNNLVGDHGVTDPCLIDPRQPVAEQGDYAERQMGYWPSYSEISPTARRAYLNWLSDGRRNPVADIGFVFLFYYGLERRAIVDALSDEAAQKDLPIIATELRRLLSIYGGKSNSFCGYASEFLDWITLPSYPSKLYEQPLPKLSKSHQLPLHLRLALGQAAIDGKPVPSSLALGWAKLHRDITLRTPATRCPEEFDQLFLVKYTELYNQGLLLPRNKTRLRLVYRPASAAFRARDSLIKILDDIPDVTVLSAPIKKLQEVVEAATKDLEPFSRLMAKKPTARETTEGLLRLPVVLWPEQSMKRLLKLKEKVGEGMISIKYEEALYSLFEETSASKDSILPLARILETLCIGIEPNVLSGAKPPKLDDQVVLFLMPSSEVPTRLDGPFMVAELTLQLASAVAGADGDLSMGETNHLREQLDSWSHLTEGQKRRLLAHIEFLTFSPVSLTQLKKKIERFAIADREMIAELIARVAVVDGDVSSDAIRILQKIYKALGVSTSKVFYHLHGAASGSEASSQRVSKEAGEDARFILNRDRIAARQADTEKVQALLATIFSDTDESREETADQDAPAPSPPPNGASSGMLLGLDQAHSTLAQRMLARQEWRREDLLQVAAELDLMLDGALEHINDAAFDAFDMPFIENDDPIVLNAEILGMLIK